MPAFPNYNNYDIEKGIGKKKAKIWKTSLHHGDSLYDEDSEIFRDDSEGKSLNEH